MIEVIKDITKGNIHSAYAIGVFDEAKVALESEGYRVISLEEMAGLRIQEGVNSSISKLGNRTREGFIFVPNKGAFFTRNSPIMANAKEATECHRNGKEFYLTDEQVESALVDSVKITEIEIPTLYFANHELTNYAFGKNAKAYGKFLKENGIDAIDVYFTDCQEKPFARQQWLQRLDDVNQSTFDSNWNLSSDDILVRGVREAA